MQNNCNKKACLISLVAVFLWLLGYDWFVHGTLLKADYEATASLWRTEEEMKALGIWCLVYHGALAAVLTCFFKKFRKAFTACHCGPECPCKQAVAEKSKSCCPIKSGGICFGLKVGLIMGLMHATSYIWMPIPGALAVKWFIAYLVQGIGAGAILGMISGKFGGMGKSCETQSGCTGS